MPRFSEFFSLDRAQAELDFVDVELDGDTRLFVDPLGLSQRVDEWSIHAHRTLVVFFQAIVDHIRDDREAAAKALLFQLSEPNETRLGFSRGISRGAGIGGAQAVQIFNRLRSSMAVKTGFITSLEDCELMIEGISHDKISDLTTNVIRQDLVAYTGSQCELHGIPTRPVALPPMFDAEQQAWSSRYVNVPVYERAPIVLVPKAVVRRRPMYNAGNYYDDFVIEFLQAEALTAQSSLVTSLRNGGLVVRKKHVKAAHPFAKEFLFRFSKDHPQVLQEFRRAMEAREREDRPSDVDDTRQDAALAESLAAALSRVDKGRDAAGKYHSLMVGVLEFIFYPQLGFPHKEREINEGRKRIDIVMENCARSGLFFELPNVRQLPCPYVLIECKNYTGEVANPELDQLAGRMGANRGMFGILCCRHFDDRATFVKRCKDTFGAMRQLIVPLDDDAILNMLDLVRRGDRDGAMKLFRGFVAEIWM